jgi:2-amino-4-hydroxy-6-hydroxymethyldihydropteridine diphosphokinase
MAKVYIGFGSNLGDREGYIKRALSLMEKEGIHIEAISPIIETEPYGREDQPLFLNGVLKARTEIPPLKLLKILKKIEKETGRKQREKWGPREIDLDILFYDDLVLNTEELKIPHSDLHNRMFVLKPLVDLDPDFIHPILKKTIRELYEELREKFDE